VGSLEPPLNSNLRVRAVNRTNLLITLTAQMVVTMAVNIRILRMMRKWNFPMIITQRRNKTPTNKMRAHQIVSRKRTLAEMLAKKTLITPTTMSPGSVLIMTTKRLS
jgi:hypothetical protein